MGGVCPTRLRDGAEQLLPAEPRAEHPLRQDEQEHLAVPHPLPHPFERQPLLPHVDPAVQSKPAEGVVQVRRCPGRVGLGVAEEPEELHPLQRRHRCMHPRAEQPVLQDLGHRRPLPGVALQAPADQVLRVGDQLRLRHAGLGQHRRQLLVRDAQPAAQPGPVGGVDQLVVRNVLRKQRPPSAQLVDDYPEAPHVERRRRHDRGALAATIVGDKADARQLGRAVRAAGLAADFSADAGCRVHVAEHQLAIAADDVPLLQVTVHHTGLVQLPQLGGD